MAGFMSQIKLLKIKNMFIINAEYRVQMASQKVFFCFDGLFDDDG